MLRALFTAATGIEAQQFQVDVIANNLANTNTNGFKKSRADFQDLLYETLRAAGSLSTAGTELPVGLQVGQGVRTVAVRRLFSQGDFAQTQNPLDVAIEGRRGFFQVLLPTGETGYTRSGSFSLNSVGQLTTSDGFLLQPPITIPPDAVDIFISSDGTVSFTLQGQPTPQQAGAIQLANFANPVGLNSIGRNIFLETTASGPAALQAPGQGGVGTLSQGMLETSNVSVAEELVNMILAQRAYEVNARVVQVSDEMLQFMNQVT